MVGLLISKTVCKISKFETACFLALEKRKGSAWVVCQIGKLFRERGKRARRGSEPNTGTGISTAAEHKLTADYLLRDLRQWLLRGGEENSHQENGM